MSKEALHAKRKTASPSPVRGGDLQRKSAHAPELTEVPPIVHDVLRSPGEQLDAPTRQFVEPRLGQDFSHVRVHADQKAADSARAVDALAYTVGSDIVFAGEQYAPQTNAGRQLLAHELAHTLQQDERADASTSNLRIGKPNDSTETQADQLANSIGQGHEPDTTLKQAASGLGRTQTAGGLLQRVPAPPSFNNVTGVYDRSKVAISELPDIVVNPATTPPTIPPLVATATFNEPSIVRLTWELYDPQDTWINAQSSSAALPTALTFPFNIHERFHGKAPTQGRYLVRCIGLNKPGEPVAYADRTFFIWTSAPISKMGLPGLQGIKSAAATRSLGEVGAAHARSMMLEHQEAVAATGKGTVEGNQCTTPTAGVAKSDCTNYVLDVLKFAFTAKGKGGDWEQVFKEAQKTSAGKFKGNELVKALVSVAGWKAVFWSPDPTNPAWKITDRHPTEEAARKHASEHPTAYKRVRDTGEYRSSNEKTGIPVDAAKSVVNYRPTSTTKREDMTGIDKLKKIPLAVITARGGQHMTLLLEGQVYEVHWDKPVTDPNVIEATPLEKWVWQSGAVVMPGEDYAKAF